MISICRYRDDIIVLEIAINEGSVYKKTLMKEDYILLKFSVESPVNLRLGDYCKTEFGRFEIVDLVFPTYNDKTGGYDYELRLDATYYKWKNKKFFYNPTDSNRGKEASWSLTRTPDAHLMVVLANLKSLNYTCEGNDYDFQIDDTVENSPKLVQYDNANIIDALTQITETWECEWWITGHTIHLGKCEFGNPVIFKMNDNVSAMTRDESQSTYANRIYAFGSTRNIPDYYRKKLEFTCDEVGGFWQIASGEWIYLFRDSTRPLKKEYFLDNKDEYRENFTFNEDLVMKGFDYHDRYYNLLSPILCNYINMENFYIRVNSIDNNKHVFGVGILLDKENKEFYRSEIKTVQIPDTGYVDIKFENIGISESDSFNVKIISGSEFSNIQASLRGNISVKGNDIGYRKFRCKRDTYDYERDCYLVKREDIYWFGFKMSTADVGDKYIFSSGLRYDKLPSSYFTPDDQDLVVEGIASKRLRLPKGTDYIGEKYSDTENIVENIVVFEDIYPKIEGEIGSVTPHTYIEETKDESDQVISKEEWTAYRFTDSDPNFHFSESYILQRQELRVQFQTGALAGMDFALIFNPYDKGDQNIPKDTLQKELNDNGTWNPLAQVYEIVRNDDYGRNLPDGDMIPRGKEVDEKGNVIREGDKFILYGYDTQLVSDSFLSTAEDDLLKKAGEYLEKSQIDPSTYTCDMFSDPKIPSYNVGDKVTLINPAYFNTDGRESRIIGFEKKLDLPYDSPKYTVGETFSYSRIGEIESKIDSLTYKGNTYVGSSSGSGKSVYLITSNDSTVPGDNNAYSAKRSQDEFLNKNTPATAKGLLTLEKGFVSNDVSEFNKGFVSNDVSEFKEGLVSKGISEFEKGISVKDVSNFDKEVIFKEGLRGSSLSDWHLGKDTNGNSILEIDKILVRMEAVFRELVIEKLSHTGGARITSPARMICNKVEIQDNGDYRCYFDTGDNGEIVNEFETDDQARCQVFNGTGLKYYWRLITGLGSNYIDLSDTDKDGNGIPQAGDEICLCGNRSNPFRQSVIIETSYGSASYIQYAGVNNFTLSGKEVTVLGRDGNKFTGDFYLENGENLLTFVDGKITTSLHELETEYGEAITQGANAYDFVTNTLPDELSKLQDQIDGQIESWFYNYSPTSENYPANTWLTPVEKRSHVGDTFTNVQEFISNEETPDAGKSWRWIELNMGTFTSYEWTQISDSDAVKALQEAAKAQDTADGKRRVFVVTPYPPYNVGDLWASGTTSYLKRCIKERLTGSYVSSDWGKADNSTDESFVKSYTYSKTETAQKFTQQMTEVDNKLKNYSTIEQTADSINLAVGSINGENFIHNSSMSNRYSENTGGCILNNVYDDKLGWCTEITRISGNGDFQVLFKHDIPLGREVILSVKAKNINNGVWFIGDSAQSYEMLTSTKYDEKRDLGDGWYLYHKKVTFQSTAYFGLNTCSGKFRMCHLQAEISEIPTVWKSSREDAKEREYVLSGMQYGKMLYRDPMFEDGYNTTGRYVGAYISKFAVEVVPDCPNPTKRCLVITSTNGEYGSPSGAIGGFYFEQNQSRAGAVFVTRMLAKIPVGLRIKGYHNAHGDNPTEEWITSNEGTGNWQEYIYVVRCGSTGEFSTINHFALLPSYGASSPAFPVTWYVSYATVYDITAVDRVATKDNIVSMINLSNEGVSIQGDKIDLTGAVSINQKTQIRPDGTLLTKDGVFYGSIATPFVGITKANKDLFIWNDVLQISEYSGFNVRIDECLGWSGYNKSVLYLEQKYKYDGVELNIINNTKGDVDIMGVWLNNGNLNSGATVAMPPYTYAKFKCLSFKTNEESDPDIGIDNWHYIRWVKVFSGTQSVHWD